MKNDSTIHVIEKSTKAVKISDGEQSLCPSEKTLKFLKLFARNYVVEESFPEGLQEMIMG